VTDGTKDKILKYFCFNCISKYTLQKFQLEQGIMGLLKYFLHTIVGACQYYTRPMTAENCCRDSGIKKATFLMFKRKFNYLSQFWMQWCLFM